MTERTDDQVREAQARRVGQGKIETPPVLTDEDEAALDAAWKGAESVHEAKAEKPVPKKVPGK